MEAYKSLRKRHREREESERRNRIGKQAGRLIGGIQEHKRESKERGERGSGSKGPVREPRGCDTDKQNYIIELQSGIDAVSDVTFALLSCT